ncbi:hypothetical protein [Actinoplanes sp. L3-i22]|uniref:hypothetical protein n=1 Tax=Actinoplanes sp. L3-i22 TaxID=2836373 RepID=UPI001C76FF2A|nr:hypothetical protein [Actinoplanes sp. L3-i22]BCY10696.1 hypothetical protein L3i22_057840 [Actinoplanes sp. L3-i22]
MIGDGQALIRSQRAVGLFSGRRMAGIGTATVCSTADGSLFVANGGVAPRSARFAYEVDVTDHEEVLTFDGLPSVEEALSFSAQVQVGWRVHDPMEIVRRGVNSGTDHLRARLHDELRDVCRRFSAVEVTMAEHAARTAFDSPRPYEVGITVYRLAVHLTLDPLARDFLRKRYEAGFDRETAAARHEVERLRQEQAHELERARRPDAPIGDVRSLIALHLARNPQDTETALNVLARLEGADRDNRQKLFEMLLTNGLIQSSDVEPFVGAAAQLLSPAPGMIPGAEPLPAWGQPPWTLYLVVDPTTGRREELETQIGNLLEVRDAHPDLVRYIGIGVVAAGPEPVVLREPFDEGDEIRVPAEEGTTDVATAVGLLAGQLTGGRAADGNPGLRPWVLLIGLPVPPSGLPGQAEVFAAPELSPGLFDVLLRALLEAAGGRQPDPAGVRELVDGDRA